MSQTDTDFTPTARTRVKRSHQRGHYDRETVYGILDAGLMCHVGYVIEGQPYVTPTAYWREGDKVYWHGSSASKMLRHLENGPRVCFTVALMDGLVLARSGFHTSVNYRSVIAMGVAEVIGGEAEKRASLEAMMERIVPGRWATLRPVTKQEIKATTVVSLKLEEVVAKVRSGPAIDDAEDMDLDVWAGVVPTATLVGVPEDNPDLKAGVTRPPNLAKIRIG
ncbi:pyridoxamine 5'-phosphate oxidase family protein [Pelagibius litoralis]|uniref:Pyridoxamine 5'-phosphate oxidase family protein n=1 Tax=Pelagibius litoralis TaxID=374515 RepID=A0A967K9G8_9PROT|nr:pyridoxamine 5'-phosphate oxidase family protein [Pelagibius litoralis]NIA71038.1 pyridoxamine 5'-phosphate oxidase family protein [Pelagibius litoralis]